MGASDPGTARASCQVKSQLLELKFSTINKRTTLNSPWMLEPACPTLWNTTLTSYWVTQKVASLSTESKRAL